MGLQSGTCNSTPGRQGKHLTRQTQGWARQNTVLFRFKHVECLVEVELKTHLQNIETFIKLGGNGFAIMGKLNVVILRYLSRDDFRVLTAVCIKSVYICNNHF